MDLQDQEAMDHKRRDLVDQEDMDHKRRLVSEKFPSEPTGKTQQFPGSLTNPNPCIVEDAQRLRVPERQFGEKKQEGKGKSPYQSQFSRAHNGATVLDRQRDAIRNLQICNMEATYQSQISGAHNGATGLDRQRDSIRNLQICNMGATCQSQFSGAHNGATVLVDRQRDATRNLQFCNMGATPEQNPGFAMSDKMVSKTTSRPVKAGFKLFGVTLTDTSTGEQDKTSCGPSQETQRNPASWKRIKVYKQGNGIGRSVDLTKFEGYQELISELEVLFNLEGQLGDFSKGWWVAYTDSDGDAILLGDEPWEEFCSLVVKIYIYKSEEIFIEEVKVTTNGGQT